MPRSLSFRARFLFVVVAVALLPLAVVGVWLTRSVSSAGEALLRARLDAAMNSAAVRINHRWIAQRSLLLSHAADSSVHSLLSAARAIGDTIDFSWPAEDDGPAITVAVPIHDGPLGAAIGTLRAALPLELLLDEPRAEPGTIGTLLGIYDAGTHAPLVPLPFDVARPVPAALTWGGERWLVAARELTEPPLLIVAGAPTSSFTAPFHAAARDGMALLAVAGLAGVLLAVLLTTRMTRSLRQLAAAADAVAAGTLDASLDERGADEVGRVARAFNGMTSSLRRTLQELADHKALAAVGEFAATLAHEIRNPLSAIRVDLQVVEEQIAHDADLQRVQRRALAQVQRLDATLSGALATARAGRLATTAVPLARPLEAAVAAARASAEAGPAITLIVEAPAVVPGDAAALHQLFLNLLLNATHAAGVGGSVRVTLARNGEDGAVVCITDDGPGIPPELRARVFDPLVSTRRGGTGLGLTIAARIARAHGGTLELLPATADGRGTTACVRLPAHAAEPTSPGEAGL
jgi:signal transduction histidine kinase